MKTTQKRSGSILIWILVGLALAAAPAFAGGQGEQAPPELSIPSQPRQYLSPNGDGTAEQLELPFSEVVVPGEGRVIVEYNLSVFNADGQVVFSVSDRQTETQGFFGRVFGGEAPRVQIPDSLTWDGTFRVPDGEPAPDGATNGEVVPDGDYTYQLTIIDDAGGFARSAPFNVTVDTEPPTVTRIAEPEYLVFSPNGDGVRDTVELRTEGSRELMWTLRILDADGNPVFEQSVENETPRRPQEDPEPPTGIVWDGTANVGDRSGEQVPEGLYSVQVEGSDRAGNSVTAESEFRLELNLSAAELSLSIADEDPLFSPNGDGVQDTMTVIPNVRGTARVVEWRLELLRGERVLRTWNDFGSVPSVFEIDGRLDSRTPLPDGDYNLRLWGRFENGNTVTSPTVEITVDTQPPSVEMSAGTVPDATELGRPLVFGGDTKSRLQVSINYETSSPPILWTAELSVDGRSYGLANLNDLVSQLPVAADDGRILFEWDGSVPPALRDAFGGAEAPDGMYEIVLRGRDPAGNRSESRPLRAIKDTRRPSVGLTVEGDIISPLTSSEFTSTTIRTDVPQTERIDEFLLEIRDSRDRVVRSQYQRQPFGSFTWRGLNNSGTIVADGTYTAHLAVIYQNGYTAQATASTRITVDRTPPRVERLTSEYRRFSPDDDGDRDTIRIEQQVVPGDDWIAQILNRNGDVVVERTYRNQVEDFTWNGTNQEGQVVPDGDYRYVLRSEDRAGNRTVEDLDLVIDTRPEVVELPPPSLELSVSPPSFTPDGDGVNDTLYIQVDADSQSPIVTWSAEIRDPNDRLWKRFRGTGTPPEQLTWDGWSAAGDRVPGEAGYQIRANVVAENEKTADATAEIRVGTLRTDVKPQVTLRILPQPFSPDGDGLADRVGIQPVVRSLNPIEEWEIKIHDPRDNTFKTFQGTGEVPRMILWDGTGESGRTVESATSYPVTMSVTDSYGNVATTESSVDVDVLIIREGDRLRIRISSIYFAPNTPDLFEGTSEQIQTNLVTLRRLAEILNGYPEYDVIVEGHAAHVYLSPPEKFEWEEREELKPLSEDRAKEVMQALMILGVDPGRLSSVGYGGTRPVVPHEDVDSLWLNRRVEFVLEK